MKPLEILQQKTSSAPLALFRIAFGIMMFLSIVRFWANGWIEKLYLTPKWHFSYYGFEWVKPLGNVTYLLFVICALSAIMVSIGWKYRLSIIIFFLSFTYIELMDKTTYLNHYYFVSIISFMMIFLPAHAQMSVDRYAFAKANPQKTTVPKWTILAIKIMLSIVYFYAGLAKINSDWLLKAQPLKIWLSSKYDLPIIGSNIMQQEWFHYAMSWSGMLYDLIIPFLLWNRKSRTIGYLLVVFFHLFTRVLFPIGMFPYIMIVGTLIFMDSTFHERILRTLGQMIKKIPFKISRYSDISKELKTRPYAAYVIALFLIVQLVFPFRYMAYPGELFWHEQGYRFSWRVMLMEKMGTTTFRVVNKKTGSQFVVQNDDFLTSFQEKQMSFQPDFILEYAHKLREHFASQGHQHIGIYADSYVALNGRRSQPFIDPTVDLTEIEESFTNKTWILPFKDEIKGF